VHVIVRNNAGVFSGSNDFTVNLWDFKGNHV
jgi:hypothetical protein